MGEFKLLRIASFRLSVTIGVTALIVMLVAACSSGTPAPGDNPGTDANTPAESQAPDAVQFAGEIVVPEFDTAAFAEINPEPKIRALVRESDLQGEFDYYEEERIPRDAINPVYTPVFVSPDEATLRPKELVMGLEINGDARAYPVGMLRIREIVNDEVGGTPVLVTW